jgi:hypothetical protein
MALLWCGGLMALVGCPLFSLGHFFSFFSFHFLRLLLFFPPSRPSLALAARGRESTNAARRPFTHVSPLEKPTNEATPVLICKAFSAQT